MIHTFPDPALPGPARVRLETPDDWACGPAPEMSFVALAPEQEGRFRPNINVAHARVAATRTILELAEHARAELERALPNFQPNGNDLFGDRDGVPAVVREYAFVDPASELALYQVQMQLLCPLSGGVADLVSVTGTCAGSQLDTVETLRSIVRSVVVGGD